MKKKCVFVLWLISVALVFGSLANRVQADPNCDKFTGFALRTANVHCPKLNM